MFRPMRRKQQALPESEATAMLQRATSGVLGVSGDDGYPYTVPLSHVYEDGRLYFHCAKIGHKIDAIKRNDKVSFCVIDQDEVIPATFNTLYRSVIAFGRARILSGDAERRHALELIVHRFSPGYEEKGQKEIEKEWERVCLVEMKIEHLTAKAAEELLEK